MKCPTCESKRCAGVCPGSKPAPKPLANDDYLHLAAEGDPGDEDKFNPFDWDDAPTQPYVRKRACPDCGSTDVAEFDPGKTEHCWACGKCWIV